MELRWLNYFYVTGTTLNINKEDIETKNVIIEESNQLLDLAALRITNIRLNSDFVYRLTAFYKKEKESYARLRKITEEVRDDSYL